VIRAPRPPAPGSASADAPLRVLVVEDSPADAELMISELERAGFVVRADVATTRDRVAALLAAGRYDVVLSDYHLPQWTGMDALALLRQSGFDTPLIIVTGTLGDEKAVDCVKEGAADYVIKDHCARLPFAVRRALSERALRDGLGASEERYRMLVETALDAIVTMDASGRITGWSPQAESIFGWTAAEAVGRVLSDTIIPPEHRDAHERGLAHFLATEEGPILGKRIELTALHRDSHQFPVELTVTSIRLREGWLFGAFIRDITERARAEQALAERASIAELGAENGMALTRGRTLPEILQGSCEALVRNLDAAFARIWTLNEPDQMLELQASAGLYTHLDGPHSRVAVGQFKIGLIASERRPHVTNTVIGDPRVGDQEWAQREGMVAFAGYPLLAQDRLVGVVAMFARHPFSAFVRDALATVADNLAVAIDRKRAEEGLRLSEQRSRTLFETVNLIVLRLDREGAVEYVNPFCLALTGYARDEVLGQDWVERFLPQAEQQEKRGLFHELVEQGLHTHHQYSILTKAGKERTIAWHNTLLRDAQGRCTGTLSIGEDVTEHLQLQQQFLQAQKMEAVGRLAGGVAHDFNNLLTAILGSSELALEDLPPDAAVREDLEEIRKAGQRAAGLTRQLLAFSRQQVLAPQVLDLNALVANMEKLLQRLIGEDVVLRTTLASPLGAVRADPGQLEQVIVNLVVNARDAMPRGGQLTIETSNVDLDEGYADAHFPAKAGAYVLLTVTDTGSGMDANTKSHLFEPFFTTKEQGKGTGLGLATVYGIVKQTDGYVWVYSELGHGTAFKIYLPRIAATADRPLDQSPAAAQRGTETVLVVEDDEQVRRLTRKMLEARGFTVLVAPGGAAALELLETHNGPIALLVTDVIMPGMSGRELAERVAVLRPTVKVLYLSGYTDDAVVRHGVLQADIAFLQKPFAADTLTRKVREVLNGR